MCITFNQNRYIQSSFMFLCWADLQYISSDLRVKHTSDSRTGKMTLLLFKRGALDQEIINISRQSAQGIVKMKSLKEVQKVYPWDM